jgi:hypothetical protein
VGLIIAAGITSALALCGLALVLARAGNWRPVALAFLIALPLQPLAFYVLRLPIDGFLRTTFGMTGWVVIVSLFYAPMTEEPAKWLAAAAPAVRRAIASRPVPVALAVGLGFGIGEIWFLAHALVTAPNYPDVPFWMFGGFMIERLEVCFLHGAFVALPFVQLARGRSFWLGGVAGMVLHFLLNLPIFLAQIDVPSLGRDVWISVLLLWVAGFVVAGALMVWRLSRVQPDAARPA